MIPTVAGVPSWGAVLIAVTFTAIGFAFDAGSGSKELTLAFAALYAIGCVAAVAAVRQSGVFTAVIQPPLLLFVAVPGSYFLFHGGSMDGIKDLLINCGYPLIERFPLMFFTSSIVLLVGLIRWYMGMSYRRSAPSEAAAVAEPSDGRFSAVTAKISGLLGRDEDDAVVDEPPVRRRSKAHSVDRSARPDPSASSSARTRSGRPTKRTAPSRSRHTRPPDTEIIEPVVDRPRRPRPRSTEPTPPPAEPRRKPRTSSPRSSSTRSASTRSSPAREPRKQPPTGERRSPYQRPDRRSRYDGFDGFEPFEPHGTSSAAGSNGNGGNGSHHPMSRVRYRGADDGDQQPQYRSRPRAAKHQADAWEYDV
jgi:hypothetical protein